MFGGDSGAAGLIIRRVGRTEHGWHRKVLATRAIQQIEPVRPCGRSGSQGRVRPNITPGVHRRQVLPDASRRPAASRLSDRTKTCSQVKSVKLNAEGTTGGGASGVKVTGTAPANRPDMLVV